MEKLIYMNVVMNLIKMIYQFYKIQLINVKIKNLYLTGFLPLKEQRHYQGI